MLRKLDRENPSKTVFQYCDHKLVYNAVNADDIRLSTIKKFSPLSSDYYVINFNPFGKTSAVNVLDLFLGTPDIVTNVLLLNSGDLRNALFTGAKVSNAYPQLEFHFTDDSNMTVARNVFLAYIMLSDSFNPSNSADIDYLWNVWYSLKWDESTRDRFVTDVKQLLADLKSPSSAIAAQIVLEDDAFDEVEDLLSMWIEAASNMPVSTVIKVLKSRIATMLNKENFDSVMTELVVYSRDYSTKHLPMAERLSKFASKIHQRVRINVTIGQTSQRELGKEEIECFVKTGNFEPMVGQTACLNPTLSDPNWSPWGSSGYLSCPFDAYFPAPIDEQLTPDFGLGASSVYNYCKRKLQSLVSEFQSKKERFTFHFYVGDCLELCLGNQKMKNKFHIVHCSDYCDVVGLANLLPATTDCLVQDNTDVMILTETTAWANHNVLNEYSTVADYVQLVLGCPLSMIPTLYGLRLTNHLLLSSHKRVKWHDNKSTSPVTLKWLKTTGFSDNVKIDMSSTLNKAVNRLAEMCFIQPRVLKFGQQRSDADINLCSRQITDTFSFLPYTPITYYYILQSMTKRCVWVDKSIHSLFLNAVSPELRLAWRTISE